MAELHPEEHNVVVMATLMLKRKNVNMPWLCPDGVVKAPNTALHDKIATYRSVLLGYDVESIL
jgi:hypothetical protein